MVIIYQLYVIFSLLITIGVFAGKLTFGLGLGDLLMLALLTIITPILGFFVGVYKRNPQKYSDKKMIFVLFILAIITLFALHLSIWRGVEMPWDGKLFID